MLHRLCRCLSQLHPFLHVFNYWFLVCSDCVRRDFMNNSCRILNASLTLLAVHPSGTKYDKLRPPTAVAAEATAIDQAVRRVLCVTNGTGTLRALFQIKLVWVWFLPPSPLQKHLSVLLLWKIKLVVNNDSSSLLKQPHLLSTRQIFHNGLRSPSGIIIS